MEAEAAQPRPRTSHIRLAFWASFVAAIAVVNYASRLSGGREGGKGVSHQEVYSYATFAGGTVIYAVSLGNELLIVVDRFDLLALRRPRRWRRGAASTRRGTAGVWAARTTSQAAAPTRT